MKSACCLGIHGQTKESMSFDVETGLAYFERICINIMVENTTEIHPDADVIRCFRKIYIQNTKTMSEWIF